MRDGKLLAEESPANLLNKFKTNSLEEVFLTLSQIQALRALSRGKGNSIAASKTMEPNSASSSIALSEFDNNKMLTSKDDTKESKSISTAANAYGLNIYRIQALLGKSWLQISRNYSGIGYMLVFPVLQILSFFLAVGDNVKDIKLAINNHENNFGACANSFEDLYATPTEDGSCEFRHLGCYFLQHLNDPMIDAVPYNNITNAEDAIRHGKVTGALYIPENFTASFHDRIIDGYYDNITLESSQIHVWLDMSNRQIGAAVRVKLIDTFVEFQKSLYSDCNFTRRFVAIPVNFDEHMYGKLDDTFTVFMVPSIILIAIYFLGVSNTANVMITDRLEGIWNRTIVAGVSSLEIVLVHFLTQLSITSVQTAIILVLSFLIYHTENHGSFVVVTLFTLLSGVCGIMLGFLVSVVSNSHIMAHLIAMGTFYPSILLSGLLWPIEGMPMILQRISLCLPLTIPIISLRNVMKKGWSILHKDVINGIGIQVLWIAILITISVLLIKRGR